MQNMLIVLVLAALWVAVLAPDLIRRGVATRNRDSVGNFNRHMSTLQSRPAITERRSRTPFGSVAQPRPLDTPIMTKSQAQRRRQDVLSSLGAAALITFLGAVSFGGMMTVVHIATDVALCLYVAALLTVTRRKRVRNEIEAYAYAPASQYDNVARIHSGQAMNTASSYERSEPQRVAQ